MTGSTASPTPSAGCSERVSFSLSDSFPRRQLFRRSSFPVQPFFRICVSSPTLDTEHTRYGGRPLCLPRRASRASSIGFLHTFCMYLYAQRASIANPPFDYYQYPSSPRTPHDQLLISWARPSDVPSCPQTTSLFALWPAAPPFYHTYPQFFRATNELWNDLPSLFTNESQSFGSSGGGHGSAPSLGLSAPTKYWIYSCPAILFKATHRSRNYMLSCH